jgi:hypothetical protein
VDEATAEPADGSASDDFADCAVAKAEFVLVVTGLQRFAQLCEAGAPA